MPRRSFERTEYWRLRRALRRQWERAAEPCWLCGQALDYTLDPQHPEAFTVDHVQPVSQFPELAVVASNMRPAHRACNTERQASAPVGLGDLTGMW